MKLPSAPRPRVQAEHHGLDLLLLFLRHAEYLVAVQNFVFPRSRGESFILLPSAPPDIRAPVPLLLDNVTAAISRKYRVVWSKLVQDGFPEHVDTTSVPRSGFEKYAWK